MQFLVFLAPEDAVVQTEHVESSHSGDNRHNPSDDRAVLEASCQNLVFGEESGERRNTGDGQAGNQEGDVGNRHVFVQAAHGLHLVAVYGVDDASGTQEKQGFEHGVSEQVEHAGHVTQTAFVRVGCGADTQCHHHETNL